MINRSRSIAAAMAAVAFLLGGCQALDQLTGSLFTPAGRPSKLKGERISVMSLDSSMKPDPALDATPVTLPPPYRNEDWANPGGYASNALYHLEASGPLHQIWTQQAGKGSDADSRLIAPPIVAGGMVYVLDAATHVFVFDAQTGKPRWDKDFAPKGKEGLVNSMTFGVLGKDSSVDPTKGAGGGLAIDGGKLFVTTGFGDVIALNPANGAPIWSINLGVPIVNAPVANGGRVFISSQDNHFYTIAQADGRKLWDYQAISENAGILESTSAAVAGEFVIVPFTSGELFALRVQNGRTAWNDMLTSTSGVTALSELDDIAGRPVVDRDAVIAVGHSGILTSIALSSGERNWTRDIGGIQTPWVAGDFIYVLSSDQQLICLTRKDGKIKWIHQMDRWEDPVSKDNAIIWSGPVLVSDRLILVSSHGYAVSISPYTGKLAGRIEIPSGAYIAPAVANDTLYIWTNDAQLVALR
jgi:outer membrane protein assembly factor BamB